MRESSCTYKLRTTSCLFALTCKVPTLHAVAVFTASTATSVCAWLERDVRATLNTISTIEVPLHLWSQATIVTMHEFAFKQIQFSVGTNQMAWRLVCNQQWNLRLGTETNTTYALWYMGCSLLGTATHAWESHKHCSPIALILAQSR